MNDMPGRLDAIDTEIASTALLAAAVSGYPRPALTIYPVVKYIATSLLVITLARRVAIVNGAANSHRIVRASTHLLDVATNIAVLYISYVGLEALLRILRPSVTLGVLGYSAGTIVGVYILYILLELTFASELAEGKRIFASSAEKHRGEALGVVLRQISGFVSQPRQSTVQTTLSRYYDHDPANLTTEEYVAAGRSFISLGLILATIIIGYSGLTAVGAWFWGSGWMTLPIVTTVLLISALVRLWYSNYGLIPVEDRNGFVTFAGEVVAFFIIGSVLLG